MPVYWCGRICWDYGNLQDSAKQFTDVWKRLYTSIQAANAREASGSSFSYAIRVATNLASTFENSRVTLLRVHFLQAQRWMHLLLQAYCYDELKSWVEFFQRELILFDLLFHLFHSYGVIFFNRFILKFSNSHPLFGCRYFFPWSILLCCITFIHLNLDFENETESLIEMVVHRRRYCQQIWLVPYYVFITPCVRLLIL